jgi:hypothetical protein
MSELIEDGKGTKDASTLPLAGGVVKVPVAVIRRATLAFQVAHTPTRSASEGVRCAASQSVKNKSRDREGAVCQSSIVKDTAP